MTELVESALQAALEDEFSSLRSIISNDNASELLSIVDSCTGILELCTAHKRQNILHLAVSNGSLSILRLAAKWKDNRAFVQHKNSWNETVLHLVAASGDGQLLRALLPLDIDQSAKDQWGRTAADVAVQMGHHALLDQELLSRHFVTPSEAASPQSVPGLAQFSINSLVTDLKKSLQRRVMDSEQHQPHQLLLPRGRPVTTVVKSIFADSTRMESLSSSSSSSSAAAAAAAAPLRDHCASKDSLPPSLPPVTKKKALSKMVEYPGDATFLQTVLGAKECSYDINGKDMFGLTALHKFAAWNKVELVDMLLAQSSIEVNVSGGKIGTPLHAAVDMAAVEVVSRLVREPRIDKSALNSCGHTAADVARQKGYAEIAALLSS